MESMSNAPYLLKKHRAGARAGHDTVYDHVFLDGLEDAYDPGKAMGEFAQATADEYQLSRTDMDEFSLESLKRAQEAIASGAFASEIAPVIVKGRKGDVSVDTDEAPGRAMPDKIPELRPAFARDGTITAASSSKISDGAAALVLTRESVAKAHGLSPVARIMGLGAHAQKPSRFTTAPVPAIQKAIAQAGWQTGDVDLFEINEAFACVTMFAMRDLALDFARVNVHGGATALGHPIGCSGARIVVTLIGALQARGKTKGVAALCIGGGEGVATALELM
jgi:acetyl-CoA C-acetyltransferase